MRFAVVLVLFAPACAAVVLGEGSTSDTAGDTASEATTAGETTTADTSTGDTATPTTGAAASSTGPVGDGLAEHGPCPNGDECAGCVQAEGTSVCGPVCDEYGPGFAGRCPESDIQGQSICPASDTAPGVCLIMCGTAEHCPDPGMVCVTCPAPYTSACAALWVYSEKGPKICAWPGG
jgi:hypothetical protein